MGGLEGSAGDARPPAAPGAAREPATTGEYRIADEVVAHVAAIAATEVEGVAGLGGVPPLGLGDVLGKRGVRAEIGSREAAVDVYLQVAYGVQIPAVAQRVQENVKRAVESMTGLAVIEVNVHVQGVDFSRAEAGPAGGPAGGGRGV